MSPAYPDLWSLGIPNSVTTAFKYMDAFAAIGKKGAAAGSIPF